MNYTELRRRFLDEWYIWYRMNYDCKHNKKYYVEISVCPEWQGPQGFLRWLKHLGPRPSKDHVLDRPNKMGDYTPDNVRWTSKKENVKTQYDYRQDEFYQWKSQAIKNGIHPVTYTNRVRKYGWTPQDAATLTPQKHKLKKRLL